MLDPRPFTKTALRILKGRVPRTPYRSMFAVVLLVPLIGDELAPSTTPQGTADPVRVSVSSANASDVGPWLVMGATDFGVGRVAPLTPNDFEPAASAPAASQAPAPSPVAVAAAPDVAPVRAAATPSRIALPPPPAPTAAPPQLPQSCPADWICYARVGVSGPIVPYTDCSGGSDVGTAIRAFMCLSPTYLLGHAYTQFGKITQWRAGDVVYAYGKQFTVTGATTQSSCAPPQLPLAPLSLQTSLSPNACGLVLVVQAR